MNIYVDIPSIYKYNTEGFCGSYDDFKGNDFKLKDSPVIETEVINDRPKRFPESFRWVMFIFYLSSFAVEVCNFRVSIYVTLYFYSHITFIVT